ncbi:MAG: hypothetical protein M0R77_21275 [Gammaproteobacteria bacterium]|jgi:hypothetical protein|nr:hypothetical protein [Acholeplasmataceae bacterium]MCK9533012.1 hypothetical protein [Gammaproteobacteria bacterium]MDY0101072.1 hypothetical protein [Bacilli bacterium]
MTKLKLSGGDIVLLKNGKIVKIADMKPTHIMVAFDEWYPISDVVQIITNEEIRKEKGNKGV